MQNEVYIVIPVHNRQGLTRRCLESLRLQDYNTLKIIVVDDGSTDGTSNMIQTEFPEVGLLHGDGSLWWTGAINKGIMHAIEHGAEFLLILNDDLVVEPNYVSTLLKTASLFPKSIVGSVEVLLDSPSEIYSGGCIINRITAKSVILNKGKQRTLFPEGYTVSVSTLTGRGTLFPVDVFKEVGLFDSKHFKQCGDTELPSRARLKGYKLFISYDAVVKTIPSASVGINGKNKYSLRDFYEYFFGVRSNFRIYYRFYLARNTAKNPIQFLVYFLMDMVRIIKHYLCRLSVG